MAIDDKQIAWLCLEHFRTLKDNEEGLHSDKIGAAMQNIAESFSLNFDDIDQKDAYSLEPHALSALLNAGVAALGAKTMAQQQAEIEENPLFQKLLTTVTAKGFFKGTTEGEPEYKERYRKMLNRFKQKLEASASSAAAATPPAAEGKAADAPPPPPPSAPAAVPTTSAAAGDSAAGGTDKEAVAEGFKEDGNALLQGKKYEESVEAYTKAIQASPEGPKSHIYFANRAAARQYLKQHQGALDDCEASIARDPKYAKAHSRLAATHGALGDWPSAAASYQRSSDLDPKNAQTSAALKHAKAKAGAAGGGAVAKQGQGMPAHSGGMPMMPGMPPSGGGGGMGGMDPAAMQQAMSMMGGGAGGGGMPGGLAGMMNNPGMMQMAQSMMSNPAMMQQAQSMMQNPAMMQQAMSMMGGGGAGGGGMNPDMAAAMAAMQNGSGM